MMGIHHIMKDYQEVWIWKRNNGSETKYGFAEKKMMGVHNVMKDYQEVWIWKKNNGSETKYGFAEKKR